MLCRYIFSVPFLLNVNHHAARIAGSRGSAGKKHNRCVGSRLVAGVLSQEKAEMEFRPDCSTNLCLFSCLGELIKNACMFQGAGEISSICRAREQADYVTGLGRFRWTGFSLCSCSTNSFPQLKTRFCIYFFKGCSFFIIPSQLKLK